MHLNVGRKLYDTRIDLHIDPDRIREQMRVLDKILTSAQREGLMIKEDRATIQGLLNILWVVERMADQEKELQEGE